MLKRDELLKIDGYNNQIPNKIKKLRRNGWIGVVGVAIGVGLLSFDIISGNDEIELDDDGEGIGYLIGVPLILGGTIYSCVNFAKAHRLQKELDSYVHAAPIFQENIKLGNGNMLSAGVDMLKSRNVGYPPGLGLRYNF